MFGNVGGDIGNEISIASQTTEFQQVISDPATLDNPSDAAIITVLQAGSIAGAENAGLSLDDTSFLKDANPVLAAPFREGFADAITRVLMISGFFAIAGLLFALFIPHVPLQEKSGLESMRDEDAAKAAGEGAPDDDASDNVAEVAESETKPVEASEA